jgi:DNA-binding ferritin-like protein
MNLVKYATLFRVLQVISHHAHNMTKGEAFFADHSYFGELYPFAESSYDKLIERAIGRGEKVSINEISREVSTYAMPEDSFFEEILEFITELIRVGEDLAKGETLGTNNLIAGIVDDLESQVYKIKQKMNK